jgi:hypothetical protein
MKAASFIGIFDYRAYPPPPLARMEKSRDWGLQIAYPQYIVGIGLGIIYIIRYIVLLIFTEA